MVKKPHKQQLNRKHRGRSFGQRRPQDDSSKNWIVNLSSMKKQRQPFLAAVSIELTF
jgi:hypothetical protein